MMRQVICENEEEMREFSYALSAFSGGAKPALDTTRYDISKTHEGPSFKHKLHCHSHTHSHVQL